MGFSYIQLPQYQRNKIHKVIMLSVRLCKNSYGFKVRCSKMLQEFNIPSMSQLLYKSAMYFMIRLLVNKCPTELYKMLKLPSRQCKGICLNTLPKSPYAVKHSIFLILINLFNKSNIKITDTPVKKQLNEFNRLLSTFPDRDWLAGLSHHQ